MNDLIVGFGLVLVFEGLLWALAPLLAVRMLEALRDISVQSLRLSGFLAVGAGVLIVWLVRG